MKTQNNNIICTVSAGYSSALMAVKIKEWYPEHNIKYVFANTGKEHKESLIFLKKLDDYFNLGIIYLEPKIDKRYRKGTSYKIIQYDNLDTKGKNFEEGIKKYGIPSVANKWCTRELKNNPIKKYADKEFGKNNYSIAIGIRVDEIDRVSKDYKTNNIFYPLIENNISNKDRNKFWSNMPFKINIPAFMGNCDFCFEKSNRKNMTNYINNPEGIHWWIEQERKYSKICFENKKQYNSMIEKYGGAYFLRGNKSIEELIEMSKNPFNLATDEYEYENEELDKEGECGQTCSLFS